MSSRRQKTRVNGRRPRHLQLQGRQLETAPQLQTSSTRRRTAPTATTGNCLGSKQMGQLDLPAKPLIQQSQHHSPMLRL